jgi:hypothetical protein
VFKRSAADRAPREVAAYDEEGNPFALQPCFEP